MARNYVTVALRIDTIRSTQPCIPPGSLNRVPASAGLRAGMSPLPGGRKGPTTEHRTPVSRYVQLRAAGGPRMLPLIDPRDVLWTELDDLCNDGTTVVERRSSEVLST